jgi:alpha-galactosidase
MKTTVPDALLSRRDLGRLVVAGALGAATTRGTAEAGEWTVGAARCSQRLVFSDGRFTCSSLANGATGREWIHPAEPSDEFLVQVAEHELTGTSGWRLAGHDQKAGERGGRLTVISLESTAHPVRVVRYYSSFGDLPLIRQWTVLTNIGTLPLKIRRIDTFRLRVSPVPAALELRWLNNFGRAMIPSPGNPIQSRTVEENTEQAVRTGPYSPDCAWFSLAIPGAGESLIGGWEWSGPMVITFRGGVDPCLVSGGLDPNGMAEEVAPGASISSPCGWYGFLNGDLDDAAALSHVLVRTRLAPALPKEGFPWAGYCTWATAIDAERNPANEPGTNPWFSSEKNLLGQVEAAASVGCELFLWDYGWFPRVGDWWFDPSRFPQGAKRVSSAVHGKGMKLGLWFGFGNAVDDSRVVREHPDWLAEYNGKPIPDDFFIRTGASTWKTRILCLAHRPAREWVKQQLARAIDEAEVDWLKHDFDLITVCQSRRHTHTPGDGRVAACEGFYEIMDFVRSRYPAIVCEHWMNDSATPDYGVIRRHHVQLIGDAYDAFRLRQMVYGHLQMFPLDRQHRYLRLEDSKGDLATVLQSSMIGGPWTLLSDPRLLAPEKRKLLAAEIGLYKRFRPLFSSAKVYRLIGRPHPRAWDAIQLWDASRGEGLLYVFRGRHPSSTWKLRLRGLEPAAAYEVDILRRPGSARLEGSRLMSDGLAMELNSPDSCELVALKRL